MQPRFSELDWLRVILIFSVFMHHVFMPFNGDNWHIMNAQSSKLLDDIMVYFEQLRLQTLFFIAGAGSLILLTKSGTGSFFKNKFNRLFVPLLVGMLLVVPPQIYFENASSYTTLLHAYKSTFPSFETNHLWFIAYLIIFMMLAIPVKTMMLSNTGIRFLDWLERIALKKHGLFLMVLALVVIRCGLKVYFPSQDNDIENLSVSVFFLFFFLAGMFFIKQPGIWRALADHRRTNLYWLMASTFLFYGYYYMPSLSAYISVEAQWQLWWFVASLVSWSGLLTMIGYAVKHCSTTPAWLKNVNELIYPFYILHQTVIVALAFYIVQWGTGIALKSISLLLSSFLVCAFLCWVVIRPFKVTRYLFGLKLN